MKPKNSKHNTSISVIIPTYNHADFLKKSIESVIAQTFSDWEIIIIDNHSKDHTEEVVKSFKNSKIKLLRIHNNGVIAASRNLGIDHAKGKWIAFLDSDDIWYPNKLSTCAQFFGSERCGPDVISTDELMIFTGSKKQRTLRHGPATQNMYRDMLMYGNRLSPSATIVRRTFLLQKNIRFSEAVDFITVEDYDFWLCLAQEKASFLFLNIVAGEYVIHGRNESHQLEKQASATECVLRKHVFELQSFEDDKIKLWTKIQSRIYFSDAIKRLKVFKILKALRLLFRSLSLSPFGLIVVIRKMINIRNKI